MCQLAKGINFTYDLCLGHMIDHWKGISDENTCLYHTLAQGNNVTMPHYKTFFRASKLLIKFMTQKTVEKPPMWKPLF
jgi:hypothetical protein